METKVAPRAGAWIETGLNEANYEVAKSLPARERGLKRPSAGPLVRRGPSLPARERGLKQSSTPAPASTAAVAPRAGAWIETAIVDGGKEHGRVAPRAGAWIETIRLSKTTMCIRSLPARERGLKLLQAT